ncbi:MAG: hypothetical protein M5U17_17355 [Ignavibacterium sp.]|nr:hypothetical protein [Ignavibacterium sp.]
MCIWTDGKKADVKHANYMLLPESSVLAADRAYTDFLRCSIGGMKEKIIFVIKLKDAIKKYEQEKSG